MPRNRLQRSLPAVVVGLAVNGLLAVGKLVAGILGHSHALVADAVESLADLFSSLVVWRGLVVAAEPADEDHPYGHGKAEPIAAAVVAAMLMLAAAGIAIQSIQNLFDPGPGPAPFTLAVLVGVVVIKEGLFRYVIRTAHTVESAAIHSDAWHHRSDAITSLAAGIGISVAIWGGPGYESADKVAALIAAVIIAWNGWHLLSPAMDELMDATPNPKVRHRVCEIAEAVSGVDRVEKCFVRKMGYRYFVDMHVEVDPQMSVQRAHDIAHQVKDRVKEQIPQVDDVLVHIEPGGGHADSESV